MTDTPTTPTTPAQPPAPANAAEAAAQLAKLAGTPEWTAKLLTGDPEARRDFDALTATIAERTTEDKLASALAGTLEPRTIETTSADELTSGKIADAVAGLRELGLGDGVVAEAFRGSVNDRAIHDAATRLRSTRLGDEGFVKKYLSGDAEAVREMTLLAVILSGSIKEE